MPGRCDIGDRELQLYATDGHTADGMAVAIAWAGVLVVGDYLSPVELPTLSGAGKVDAYLATLGRLRPLVADAAHVVPGHGPVLDGSQALDTLEQDCAYLQALRDHGAEIPLPAGRRSTVQRRAHAENVANVVPGARSAAPGED
jgi:glyoxylase-like metal-dependent hydrolase (beta-lactamase superfamily II)